NGDGMTNSPVGTNGLDNDAAIETADNYADVNGLAYNGSIFILADTDADTSANGSDATPTSKDLDYRDDMAGYAVSGRVYKDTNVNGVNDGIEAGISGLSIVLMKADGSSCVSTRTNAKGHYTFKPVLAGNYKIYEASREKVPAPPACNITRTKDPAGYRSTSSNVLDITMVDADITDQDFGDINDPTFSPDHSGSVLAGNVVFYRHTFTPKSTGEVNFTSVNSTPITAGWSSIIYQDDNCNGKLDGMDASGSVAPNIPTTKDVNICLINKVFAPNNVTNGETFKNVITADFDFTNNAGALNAIAGSVQLKVTDFTKAAANDPVVAPPAATPVVGESRLELRKTVQNISQGTAETENQNQAKPGDVLKYRIYYSNTGTGPITDLKVNDVVPDFTMLNGLPVCDDTPATLVCTPNSANDPDIKWDFTGTLEGGGKGLVSFSVMIE
ncbi:MAG: DUF11 domain-containing protein, partial [Cocleimonas sp.]|nr:DUF11 domain-containing protein [Cocleimonas sp.]